MRVLSAALVTAGLILLPLTSSATVRPHRHTTAHPMVRRTATGRTHRAEHVSSEHAAYSGISSERATEIQSALIKQGYLSGEPSGTWDAASAAAMQKLQADNGWQTRLVPDSRALIKLGLGPNSTPDPATTATASAEMPVNN